MPQTYTTRQKRAAARPAEDVQPAAEAPRWAVPMGNTQEGGMGDQLGELMQARMRQHFMDHQNPAAEREADQLSAGLDNARTPEEVKSRLGERLGADFSGVRFHTGSGAVSSAEQMGARAYATGRDVYFGEGGFDPAVAAHELVHTVQQGQVESSAPTVSAPAGQVQMMPKLFKKIGGLFKRGSKEAEPAPEAVPEPAPEAGLGGVAGGLRMQLASAQAGEAARTITGEAEPVTEAVPESISEPDPGAGLGGAAGGLSMQLASAQAGAAAETLTKEKKEKKPSLLSRAWGGIKKGAAYVGGAISGKLNSLKRQHQRAVDDLNHHREDYSWPAAAWRTPRRGTPGPSCWRRRRWRWPPMSRGTAAMTWATPPLIPWS